MKTYVIGDIHGGLKSLIQVLDKSPVDLGVDRLIFLGDYVDGWSESSELVEYLRCIQLEHDPNMDRFIFLRGNHDKWVETWLTTGVKHPYWLPNGGESTYKSYRKTLLLTNKSHIMFYYNMKNYYIDEENRAFVHGGFDSRKGVGNEIYSATYYWDRDLWQLALLSDGRVHNESALVKGISHTRRFENHKEVYLGHTPTVNYECNKNCREFNDVNQLDKSGPITVPMNRCNVWNIDTGAGFSGRLTIMDIDTKEYWQSDLLKDLYSDELGRG